jgi:hypothetical protein
MARDLATIRMKFVRSCSRYVLIRVEACKLAQRQSVRRKSISININYIEDINCISLLAYMVNLYSMYQRQKRLGRL